MGAADLYRVSPSIGEHRAVAARVTALETAPPPGGGSVTYETVPPGSTFTLDRSGGAWPARPTARTDVVIRWRGVSPAPPLVASGTAGMYAGDEFVEELP